MKQETGKDLIKCPRCGEAYSVSYRRCPFCEEDDNPRRVKSKQRSGRRVTEKKKTYSGRGALIVILLLVLALLTWVLFGESLLERFVKPTEETPAEETVPPESSGDIDPFYDPSVGEDPQTPADVTDPDAVTPPSVDTPEVSDTNADVSNAKLSNEDFTIYVGESVQLRVTGTDAAAAWSSKDSTVAVVGSSGLVTAVNPGTTTITAKVGDRVLEGIARVKSAGSGTGVSGAELNRSDITLGVGESFQLKVNGTDSPVTWSIEDSGVASISSSGVVKGIKAGSKTYAYAKVGGETLSCVVRIK